LVEGKATRKTRSRLQANAIYEYELSSRRVKERSEQ
jgi:hypothetical protein